MKKFIFLLIISKSFLFAQYSILFNEIKLGEINSFDTLEKDYIKIKVTNPIAKFMLGKKELIYFNSSFKQDKTSTIYYKKDKYEIINVLKGAISNELEDKKIFFNKKSYLDIKYDKNYKFSYFSKGRVKTSGEIDIFQNELISLNDTINKVQIIKNN